MQHCFDTEHTDTVKQPSIYARSLLEYCSFKALHLVAARPNYLADKDFSRLTFDMMLAWEGPGADSETLDCVRQLLPFLDKCFYDIIMFQCYWRTGLNAFEVKEFGLNGAVITFLLFFCFF